MHILCIMFRHIKHENIVIKAIEQAQLYKSEKSKEGEIFFSVQDCMEVLLGTLC